MRSTYFGQREFLALLGSRLRTSPILAPLSAVFICGSTPQSTIRRMLQPRPPRRRGEERGRASEAASAEGGSRDGGAPDRGRSWLALLIFADLQIGGTTAAVRRERFGVGLGFAETVHLPRLT